MTRTIMAAALVVCTTAGITAQSPGPRFEVASIRPAARGVAFGQRLLPGRVEMTSTSLRSLLMMAFDIQARQLIGPGWLDSVSFDLQATMPAGLGREHVPEMLRNLLVERFGLVARVEERLVDGYELIVGEGGLKMREVEAVDELSKDFGAARFDRVSETLDGPARAIAIPFGTRIVTSRSLYSTRYEAGTMLIDAERMAISELVRVLTVNLYPRAVVDKTGLTGLYAFKIRLDRPLTIIVTTRADGTPIVREPTGVSTFKAIESLGLKLEERRVPLDFVIVESIDRTPTEN